MKYLRIKVKCIENFRLGIEFIFVLQSDERFICISATDKSMSSVRNVNDWYTDLSHKGILDGNKEVFVYFIGFS